MVHNIRHTNSLMRFKFIILVAFCQFIPPQLCYTIEDYENLDEYDGLVDGTKRIERGADYPAIRGANKGEELSSTCVDHFCENVSDYPLHGVNNAIKNIPNYGFPEFQGEIELQNRIGFSDYSDEGTTLCNPVQHFLYPQQANNTNNKKVFIINVPTKRQKIVMWTCSKDKKTGKCGDESLPDGYTAECVQKFTATNLLIYKNEGGNDVSAIDSFLIPSCCICKVKKTNG